MHSEAQRIKDKFGDGVIVEEFGGTVKVTHVRHWIFETKDPHSGTDLPPGIVKNAADECIRDVERIEAVFRR
jgi:hypothetical protein